MNQINDNGKEWLITTVTRKRKEKQLKNMNLMYFENDREQ
jgi:hypothetical protein